MMEKSFRRGTSWAEVGLVFLVATILLTACGLDQQVLYDRGGRQVGLQQDPTTDVIGLGDIGSGPASPRNDHPYTFEQSELRQLLGSLSVSVLDNDAQPSRQLDAPLYRPDELNKLIPWLTAAFSRASRTDRVFFSLASTPFSSTGGRTTGTIFVRHRSLHVALTPFVLPVEGEVPHIVDRPMTIRAAEPVQEVVVESPGVKLWSKSETIHISLQIPEALPPELNGSRMDESAELAEQTGRTERLAPSANTEAARENSSKTLQRQVEDLTAALKELQARNAGQTSELESVKAELKRLQDQIANQQLTPLTKGGKVQE